MMGNLPCYEPEEVHARHAFQSRARHPPGARGSGQITAFVLIMMAASALLARLALDGLRTGRMWANGDRPG